MSEQQHHTVEIRGNGPAYRQHHSVDVIHKYESRYRQHLSVEVTHHHGIATKILAIGVCFIAIALLTAAIVFSHYVHHITSSQEATECPEPPSK